VCDWNEPCIKRDLDQIIQYATRLRELIDPQSRCVPPSHSNYTERN
jgi:hypothetical protein